MRLRIFMVMGLFGLVFVAVATKAVYLQVVRGPWLSERARDSFKRTDTLQGKRGIIYDRSLQELAVSVKVDSVAANPSVARNPKKLTAELDRILDIDKKTVLSRLLSGRKFAWIKRHVPPKDITRIRELGRAGIHFVSEYSRVYPNKTMAGQLIGFCDLDGLGLEGIEFRYNTELKGPDVTIPTMADALGRRIQIATDNSIRETNTGRHVVLTIESAIQYASERALERAVTEHKAKSGVAVVMMPETGEVLAMAHFPPFNPNAIQKSTRSRWRNRAITDAYEPGSTMKIFSAAAALESGLCSPNTIFFCENGKYRVGGHTIHDAGHKEHEWLSLKKIIQVSSNIGTVKIAQRIGAQTLYDTLRNFGFGKPTGIDSPGETHGMLSNYKRWARIDFAAISFGQGVSASALQLTAAAAAIANDGVLMQPYLVQAILDRNGKLVHSILPKKVRRVISVQTARNMRKIMTAVTQKGGTGTRAALEGYTVAGKTGTAQKPDDRGSYASNKYVSSFLGFLPAHRPAAVILVAIDEPTRYHYGGTVAAPAFRTIAKETMDYLNISPGSTPSQWMAAIDKGVRG